MVPGLDMGSSLRLLEEEGENDDWLVMGRSVLRAPLMLISVEAWSLGCEVKAYRLLVEFRDRQRGYVYHVFTL